MTILEYIYKAILLFAAITVAGCVAQKEIWPPEVLNDMWAPKESQIVERHHRGTYEMVYTVNVCYPAKNVTDDMVNSMTLRGWERLSYDPYNPWISPNSGLSRWNRTMDKDYRVGYGWLDYWEDREKNVIEYHFKYEPQKRESIVNNEECSLAGVSTYIPKDLMHEIQKKIKEEENARRGIGATR